MEAEDIGDLHGGQRSTEVLRYGKLSCMATKLGQKNRRMHVLEDDDLRGGQRSTEVKCSNYAI